MDKTTPTAAPEATPIPPSVTAPRREASVPIALIDKEHNYRRTIDEAELRELAASIRRHGVLQRIVLRPKGKRYGLVAGERRWRAVQLTGADLDAIGPAPTELPALIVELSDAQVREVQAEENGKRKDVHPLDEADLFREMMDKDGKTVPQIAATISKSPGYVYAKLKLCALAKGPRKAFLAGELAETTALLIARIPRPDLQEQACKEVLGQGVYKDYAEGVDPGRLGEGKKEGYVPLTTRQAQAHIQGKYMLRLELVRFPTDDRTLVPAAGACTSCEHRTGNQRELFGDVVKSAGADICTNPPCFEGKTKAAWDRRAAEATRAGQRVLNDKENKNIFVEWNPREVAYGAAYVDPDAELPYDVKERTTAKTWRTLFGKQLPPLVLAQDGTGAARELLDRNAAIKTAEKLGLLKAKKSAASSSKSSSGSAGKSWAEQRKKEQEAAARKQAAHRIALGKIAAAAGVEPKTDKARFAWWRFASAAIVKLASDTALGHVVHRRKLARTGAAAGRLDANSKALLTYLGESARTLEDLRGLVVEVLAAPAHYSDQALKAAAELFDVDLKKCAAEAAAETKATKDAKVEAKKGAKKAAKKAAKKGGK